MRSARIWLGPLLVGAALVAPSTAGAFTWGPVTVEMSTEPAYVEQIVDTSTDPAQVYTTGWIRNYTVTAGDVSMCKRGDPPTGFVSVTVDHREYHHPNGPGSGAGYLFDEPGTVEDLIAGDSSFMDDQEIVTGPKLLGTDTVVWSFRCLETEATVTQTFPVYLVPEGYVPPSGGPPTGPDPKPVRSPEQLARIRHLEELIAKLEGYKLALEQRRHEMEEALEDLEQKNELFCATAASLSVLRGLHAFQWNGSHVVPETVLEELSLHGLCEKIPNVLKWWVDADRQVAENAELIRQVDEEIARRNEELRGLTISRAISWSLPAAVSAAKVRSPLAALKSRRTQALRTLHSLSGALRSGDLERAKRLAEAGASRFAALPAACGTVKRYLKKSGLGKRISRARVLRALRRLKGKSLPPSSRAFARALGIKPAQMRGMIRAARKLPRSSIRATALTDIICNPRLNSIDRALAGTLKQLAATF